MTIFDMSTPITEPCGQCDPRSLVRDPGPHPMSRILESSEIYGTTYWAELDTVRHEWLLRTAGWWPCAYELFTLGMLPFTIRGNSEEG